jgi:hypothetical protein
MNLDTKEINYYSNPNFKQYGNYYLFENKLYILPYNPSSTSNILEFDLTTKQFNNYMEGIVTIGSENIFYNNKLYFFGYTNYYLYSFNLITKEEKIYNKINRSDTNTIFQIINGKLYKFDRNLVGQYLIEIDLDKLD